VESVLLLMAALMSFLLIGAGVVVRRSTRGAAQQRAAAERPALSGRSGLYSHRPVRQPEPTDGIFISYRRQDEPNFAGRRLYERLVERFSNERVFIDVDSIDLSLGFAEVIDRSLARCKIMLVVIGKDWLDAADTDGQRRLSNPDDYVRVIPVVVEGAIVPRSSELPSSMASLARRNGIEMSHARFSADVDRLIRAIESVS
jgi:TIR domain